MRRKKQRAKRLRTNEWDTAFGSGQTEVTWQQELERRVKEVDSAQVQLVPWSDVRSQLLTQSMRIRRKLRKKGTTNG
ncbi:MAG: addiction module protein [Candidatus Acidiferrales bacterium]